MGSEAVGRLSSARPTAASVSHSASGNKFELVGISSERDI